MPNELDQRMRGQRLSAVVFVEDYVQLQFGGPDFVLTLYVLPEFRSKTMPMRPGDIHWRNALCELIGRKIIQVLLDDDHVEFCFDGDARLRVDRALPTVPPEILELRTGLPEPIVVLR